MFLAGLQRLWSRRLEFIVTPIKPCLNVKIAHWNWKNIVFIKRKNACSFTCKPCLPVPQALDEANDIGSYRASRNDRLWSLNYEIQGCFVWDRKAELQLKTLATHGILEVPSMKGRLTDLPNPQEQVGPSLLTNRRIREHHHLVFVKTNFKTCILWRFGHSQLVRTVSSNPHLLNPFGKMSFEKSWTSLNWVN